MHLSQTLQKIKQASRKLSLVDPKLINKTLNKLAEKLEKNSDQIIEENKKDLEKIDKSDPIYDRVLLDSERIKDIVASVREIADTDSPIGEEIEHRTLANNLDLRKVRTPLGVVGAIFEARPNVVIDIFALCFKSQNACVLKGGSQSEASNMILMDIIKSILGDLCDVVDLLPNDHELVAEFMKMDEYVDVIVPRGGRGLIDFVRENATIPVIETGAGVVHTYFDEFGETEMGADIIYNAKTGRPSVCNALDTLLVHEKRLDDLVQLCEKLGEHGVEIHADKRSFEVLKGSYPEKLLFEANKGSFGMEYLSLKMSVKVVNGLDEAIDHINKYGSGHSEAIVSENEEICDRFLKEVDAACVYTNASTRFTDGIVFGFGAEVGISTQKLHARGPMGIKELTGYKWEVRGDGQVR